MFLNAPADTYKLYLYANGIIASLFSKKKALSKYLKEKNFETTAHLHVSYR